jgi:hypothetical protein
MTPETITVNAAHNAQLLIDAAHGIRLNGSAPHRGSNGDRNISYLANNEPELLALITTQASRSEVDRTFWHMRISHADMTDPKWAQRYNTSIEKRLREHRACLLLIDKARPAIRRHPGNFEYAVGKIMVQASALCWEGVLDQSPENLSAALYALVITDELLVNDDGQNNQLIEFMADRLDFIEANLGYFDTPELTIAYLESFMDERIPASLQDGFL